MEGTDNSAFLYVHSYFNCYHFSKAAHFPLYLVYYLHMAYLEILYCAPSSQSSTCNNQQPHMKITYYQCLGVFFEVKLSNTDGFKDRNYVFLLHSYMNLCPWLHNHFCTLLWSMQASPFPYYELTTSNTKIIQNKSSKPSTILFHQVLHLYNNFVTSEGVSQGHNTHLYIV